MNKSSSSYSVGERRMNKGKSRFRNCRRRRNKHQKQYHSHRRAVSSGSRNANTNEYNSHSTIQFPKHMQSSDSNLGFQLWSKTYENLVRWQATYQVEYWKKLAIHLKNENENLRRKMQRCRDEDLVSTNDDNSDKESDYMTSSESEADEVDEGYLEFIKVTKKHQENLKIKRQIEEGNLDDLKLK